MKILKNHLIDHNDKNPPKSLNTVIHMWNKWC